MNTHEKAAPVEEKFLTPGVMVMLAFLVGSLAPWLMGWPT